jgi:hypothetical protein
MRRTAKGPENMLLYQTASREEKNTLPTLLKFLPLPPGDFIKKPPSHRLS